MHYPNFFLFYPTLPLSSMTVSAAFSDSANAAKASLSTKNGGKFGPIKRPSICQTSFPVSAPPSLGQGMVETLLLLRLFFQLFFQVSKRHLCPKDSYPQRCLLVRFKQVNIMVEKKSGHAGPFPNLVGPCACFGAWGHVRHLANIPGLSFQTLWF